MKTYILNNLDRITNYGKALNAKSNLYNKNWEVLNENNEKEVLIFRPKGELLVAKEGIITKNSWEILATGSIVINTDSKILLFNTAFFDTNVLILQLDGTKECMIMVDSDAATKLMLDGIKQIKEYLQDKYATKEELQKIEHRVSKSISDWKFEFRLIKFLCLFIYVPLFMNLWFGIPSLEKLPDELFYIAFFSSLVILYLLLSILGNNTYLNHRIEKYKIKNPKDPLNPYLKANWRI